MRRIGGDHAYATAARGGYDEQNPAARGFPDEYGPGLTAALRLFKFDRIVSDDVFGFARLIPCRAT